MSCQCTQLCHATGWESWDANKYTTIFLLLLYKKCSILKIMQEIGVKILVCWTHQATSNITLGGLHFMQLNNAQIFFCIQRKTIIKGCICIHVHNFLEIDILTSAHKLAIWYCPHSRGRTYDTLYRPRNLSTYPKFWSSVLSWGWAQRIKVLCKVMVIWCTRHAKALEMEDSNRG